MFRAGWVQTIQACVAASLDSVDPVQSIGYFGFTKPQRQASEPQEALRPFCRRALAQKQ